MIACILFVAASAMHGAFYGMLLVCGIMHWNVPGGYFRGLAKMSRIEVQMTTPLHVYSREVSIPDVKPIFEARVSGSILKNLENNQQ